MVRREGDFYWTTLHGAVTNAELLAFAQTATELEATHDVIPHRLVDFGSITEMHVDYEGMNAFARQRMSKRFPNEFKSALIAPDLIHFGFARMYQTLVSHSQIRVAIFPTTAEALQWLSLPGLDLPESLWSPPSTK